MKRLTLALLAVLLLAAPAFAQQGVPGVLIQSSPTMLNACYAGATGNGTAQQTITITPPAGQYVYLCGIDYQYCVSASTITATNNVSTTTTGFPSSIKWNLSMPTTASVCYSLVYYPSVLAPVKSSQPGTSVTIVTPAAVTNLTFNINAYYYFGP